jgi:2,4-dichlorophenol 6-monooxygenase
VARRAALAEALQLKNTEFNALGTETNQRCVSGAVIPDPDAGEERFARDPGLYAQATTRPGAKIPHAWLVGPDGRRRSTLDLVGKGLFTLVTGLAGAAWVEAARGLAEPCLRTLVIGAPGALDVYFVWHRIREIDEAGALLVRPDGVIAWRHRCAAADPALAAAMLRDALGAVLGRG